MNTPPDLVIRPTDFILALWWEEWPTVTAHDGGQWFAWIRRDHARAARCVWHLWTSRRQNRLFLWERSMVVLECSAQEAFERGCGLASKERQGKIFRHGNSVAVNGTGGGFRRVVEQNPGSLPPWLHVVVIEGKGAAVTP